MNRIVVGMAIIGLPFLILAALMANMVGLVSTIEAFGITAGISGIVILGAHMVSS